MVNRVIDRLCQVQGVEYLPVIEIKELLDVSYQGAKKIHDGGGISMATAMRAAEKMPTIEPLWLMTGVGPMLKPEFLVQEPAEQYSVAFDAPGLPPAQPSLQPILAWDHPDDLPEGEFVMVPKLDIKLSAGNGHEQLEINLTRSTPLAFRASWVREKRLKPSKLAAMSATGNSMEPGIFDGDSLVVDTSQTEVLDGKVYALWYDGGERVKRLYRLPGGGLRIKSDNPDHPPIEVQPEKLEHVRILGRVVHRSGDGGL
jgi:phage repressor protein C with HTH and peptisase S24 domain